MAKPKLEDVLAMVPLFRGLTRRHLKWLAGYCDVADFMPGHAIVKQGDPGDSFFVVLDGQASVTKGKKFLARLLPGDHFGEIAVIDGGPRTASVTSETPMTLAILSRADFRRAMKDDPDLSYHMMVELAQMIRRVQAQPD